MWIELHQSLPRHPKLIRLASRLRVPRAQAAGHLTFLWLWTLDYSPTGNISAFGPAELSAAADFGGDAELFAKALRECGWVDDDGMIHDWLDYAGRIVTEREQSKARMRTWRERQKNEPVTNGDVTRNESVTNIERSGLPNLTTPNHTQPNRNARGAPLRQKPKSVDELIATGATCGVSEADCRDWYRDMEVSGWSKVDGTPFSNWPRELTMHRDRLRESRSRNGTAKPAPPTNETPEQYERRRVRESL